MKLSKSEQKLIREFDQENTTLVISHWPISSTQYDGVATYTENTLTKFANDYNHRFVVLVPYDYPGKRIRLVHKNILLIGVFNEKRLHLYPQISGWLAKFPRIKKVVVHSEFCASGGLYVRAMVVPFLALIKLAGKHITYYAHNVANDIGEYAPHLGLSKGWKLALTRVGYTVYLKSLQHVVDRFVVLEQSVARRLTKIMGEKKEIVVAPHWIEPGIGKITKALAKKKLGVNTNKSLVVSFGFVSWYKGSDVVMDAAKLAPNYQFVLAGGRAVSLQDKDHYQSYYGKLSNKVKKVGNVRITGFLTNEEIDLWLVAADLVILPYRLSMGGSGALQQALRHGKSLLMSKAMQMGIDEPWPLTFASGDAKALVKSIEQYFRDKKSRRIVASSVEELKRARSIDLLLSEHYQKVYGMASTRQPMLKWMGEQVKTSLAMVLAK